MRPTIRYRVEVVAGLITAILAVATLVMPDWIEAVFHVNPDGGNGAVEWGIVLVLGVMTAVLWSLAYVTWKRAATAK